MIEEDLERIEIKLDRLISHVLPVIKEYKEQSIKAKQLTAEGKKPRKQPRKFPLIEGAN